jgi:hypothetical protein
MFVWQISTGRMRQISPTTKYHTAYIASNWQSSEYGETVHSDGGYELSVNSGSMFVKESYSGVLNFETLLRTQKIKFRTPQTNNHLANLINISQAEIMIDEIDLIRLLELLWTRHSIGVKNQPFKFAIIAQTYRQLEIATIFKIFSENKLPVSVRIFSSERASLNWLLYNC